MPPVYCLTCLLQLTSSNSSKICVRATEGWRGEGKEGKEVSWAVGSTGTTLEDVVLHSCLSDSIKADGTPVKLPCAFYCFCSGPQSTQSDVQTWHIQAIASSVFLINLIFFVFYINTRVSVFSFFLSTHPYNNWIVANSSLWKQQAWLACWAVHGPEQHLLDCKDFLPSY